ncbi:MAG: NAD-dependent epimerase/dehydratase family protein [Pyrinomonadaceae bacterium]
MSRTAAQNGERVVVLGGLGFMGSHLCRALVAGGRAVRVFDRPQASRELLGDIARELEIVEGDVARAQDVVGACADADVLVHLVHTTVPGSSMEDPAYDLTSNVVTSVNWLRRLGETGVRRLIFVSSGGTVYGVPRTVPIGEDHPTDPISSYGITKLAIEKYVSAYASMLGIDYCIIRPSNVYGPGQRLHTGQGVIGVTADRALRGEPLELWGDGESLRDYLYVEDMAASVVSLLDYAGEERVFNASSGEGRSVLDIIETLREQLGPLPEVVRKPFRGFDVPVNVLDSSRLRRATGWRPSVTLREGVARTLEWLKARQK